MNIDTSIKINNVDGILVVSSRVVAEQLAKEHKRVLQDVREKLLDGIEFVPSTYKTIQNKKATEYLLTKDGFILLCMNYEGYNDLKRAYINKFNKMERELIQQKDSYMIDDPIERAKKWVAEQEEKKMLQIALQTKEQIIQESKPKIEYLDTILKSENTMTITQIAADYGISGKALNKILHENKIQHNVGGQWLLYKAHMNKGYTQSETTTIRTRNNKEKVIVNTKWKQKGRLKIHEVLTKLGILANMDKKLVD